MRANFDAALRSAADGLDVIRPQLSELQGAGEVLVYSYGARGADLARQLRAVGIEAVIYDNAPSAVVRAETDGFRTTRDLTLDLPLIVAAGQNQIEILDNLTRPAYGLAEALYALDLRNSYGQARAFTDGLLGKADALFAVYEKLDVMARPAFLDLLCFRASLDVRLMIHRRPMSAQFDPPVPALKIKSFCDLGAYDGDSLEATKALFPGLTRSFTIEPGAAQAPVIAAVAERIGVRNTNFVGAAWDRRTMLGAKVLANGMMVLDEGRDGDIQTETLDVLLGDEVFDYFKLDVEGSEARVLTGGVEAMKRAKCVAVAAYHLPDDLTDLPAHFERLMGDDASSWKLAFAHYSQSLEDSFLYFHR